MLMGRREGILLGIGVLFLVNAIFGRYLVLPGYLSALEAGHGAIEMAGRVVPLWKIVRYLLWAYSFKLGVFFVAMGVLLGTSIPKAKFWIMTGGGILYLLLAYVPLPGPYPLLFGLGGGLITLVLILIFLLWAKERDRLAGSRKIAADYRLIGYFFFAMATYNLCPLMGVKTFGLYPEKMIRYGLQSEASSFATRIMVELVLGWVFILFSHYRSRKT
jgi:hypothetical protein